jgi:hypothetical protein
MQQKISHHSLLIKRKTAPIKATRLRDIGLPDKNMESVINAMNGDGNSLNFGHWKCLFECEENLLK